MKKIIIQFDKLEPQNIFPNSKAPDLIEICNIIKTLKITRLMERTQLLQKCGRDLGD